MHAFLRVCVFFACVRALCVSLCVALSSENHLHFRLFFLRLISRHTLTYDIITHKYHVCINGSLQIYISGAIGRQREVSLQPLSHPAGKTRVHF